MIRPAEAGTSAGRKNLSFSSRQGCNVYSLDIGPKAQSRQGRHAILIFNGLDIVLPLIMDHVPMGLNFYRL